MTADWMAKVLGLLAKAESTEYPAEAEALFGKASELMARHAIDEAMLSAAGKHKGAIIKQMTVVCDAPYASAKSSLFAAIAGAQDCRPVLLSTERGHRISVVGFEDDLRAARTLYLALSIHATREMFDAPVPHYEGVRAFRHAFLLGFAARIEQRLIAARVTARRGYEDDHGTSTAVVLADRSAEVEREYRRAYPHVRTVAASTSSVAGSHAGVAAGNRADLGQDRVGGHRGQVTA